MAKYKEQAVVVSQEQIAEGIYSLWLQTERIAKEAKAGQFISMYAGDESRLLPRPISICQIYKGKGQIRVVYRVTGAGTGTEGFSRLREGEAIQIIGPLGNGFPVDKKEKAFLIGGGIGIPPMLELARELDCEKTIIAGYKDEQFLAEELRENGDLYIATEDGSAGTRGNVLDAIREHRLTADVIYACGPTPMLRAIKAYAEEHNILCYLSLEERMACGIGACLACVCQSKEKDSHSNVKNKRVCKDGPVFLSAEVEL